MADVAPHHQKPGMTCLSASDHPPSSSHPPVTDARTDGEKGGGGGDDEDDADAILASLEAEIETEDGCRDEPNADLTSSLQHLSRESRAQKLADQVRHARQYHNARPNPDGTSAIQDLADDDQVLRFTTQTPTCLVHFAHPDFARCAVMDIHLARLAVRHGVGAPGGEEVRFARADARKCAFVVDRLKVKVLPCLVGFRDGVVVGRMVGFEGLVGATDFADGEDSVSVTKRIEALVVGWQVFAARTKGWGVSCGLGGGDRSSADDDDGDEDDEEASGEQWGRRMGRRERNGGLFGRRNNQRRKREVGHDEDGDEDDWD